MFTCAAVFTCAVCLLVLCVYLRRCVCLLTLCVYLCCVCLLVPPCMFTCEAVCAYSRAATVLKQLKYLITSSNTVGSNKRTVLEDMVPARRGTSQHNSGQRAKIPWA